MLAPINEQDECEEAQRHPGQESYGHPPPVASDGFFPGARRPGPEGAGSVNPISRRRRHVVEVDPDGRARELDGGRGQDRPQRVGQVLGAARPRPGIPGQG
ncbi:MAG: hypothetical protein WKF43_11675 [Acidimicrobiales bacterium]